MKRYNVSWPQFSWPSFTKKMPSCWWHSLCRKQVRIFYIIKKTSLTFFFLLLKGILNSWTLLFLIKIQSSNLLALWSYKKKLVLRNPWIKSLFWNFQQCWKHVLQQFFITLNDKLQGTTFKMTSKLIMLVSRVIFCSIFTKGKTTSKWHLVKEWHTQPSKYVANWTLREDFCLNFYGDCWLGNINTKVNNSGNQFVSQICPLQIQIGDFLVISSEPSLQYPEIMNISEASFTDCLQNTTTEDHLCFFLILK